MTPVDTPSSHWSLLEPAVPVALKGKRVLLCSPAVVADDLEQRLSDRGAAVVRWDPVVANTVDATGCHLAICVELLQSDPHPSRILGRLWASLVLGGTLLVQSLVIDEPGKSQFARFVSRAAGTGDSEWLPGRLALRWSLETSGFDVVRWLDSGKATPPSREGSAYLEVARVERYPSLTLATPTDPAEVTG
jgi:hypothetical protein